MSNKIEDNKCILYIDDESQVLLPVLELFEEDFNYSILTESSVQEGLKTLNAYHGVIDAILLDLKFPKEELQGIDALKNISENHPYLPVFILTSTEPEENETARACLDLGAIRYYHKVNFDAKSLLIEINNATQFNTDRKRFRQFKDFQNTTTDLVPFLKYFDSEEYPKTGIFAYLLSHTVTTDQKENYNKWSTEVLRTLSIGFHNLSIKQLYNVSKDGFISTSFIFMLGGDSIDAINEQFKEVFFNFSLFFNQKRGLQPGLFYPILSPEHLESIILLEHEKMEKDYRYLFTRNTKKIATQKSVEGFKQSNSNKTSNLLVPIQLPNTEKQFDELFQLLSGIEDVLIINKIRKVKLNVNETKSLHKSRIELTGQNAIENLAYLDDVLNNQQELVQLETYFYTSQSNCTAILNKINEVFYSNKASYQKLYKDFIIKYPVAKEFERLPYVYSTDTASRIFMLPYLKEESNNVHDLINQKELYVEENALDDSGVIIGNHQRGDVHLDEKQFKKHTYIIGKTGTGKTSVLFSMIMDQIQKGKGTALIDPHGDIFNKVLELIPAERYKDLIVFDPTNQENDFGFNILEYDKNFPEQQTFIVNELIKIFSEIYDMKSAGGPMFEMYFKNAVYLIMDAMEHPTLEDVEKVFVDDNFRKHLLQISGNTRVKGFFSMAAKTVGEQGFENFGPYIASKLTRFTDNYLLRKVICDPKRSFSFRKMIDSNKIFLVKLNKGRLGSEGVNFIGRLLFNKIIMAAYTRENISEDKRKDFAVFVDEFQNFTSGDIVSALAETRKYHLQLILANQTFAQLEESVAKNILSNVGSIITAAISPFDADMIEPFLEPEFTKQDIVQLDNYKFIISTLYNNKRVKPFIFKSLPY